MTSPTTYLPSSKAITSFSDSPFLRLLRQPSSQSALNDNWSPRLLEMAEIAETPMPPQPLRAIRIPIDFGISMGWSLEAFEAERNLLLLEEVYSGLVRWRCSLEGAEA